MSSTENPQHVQVRDDLVNTAIKFLENPHVKQSSLANKQAFLKKKGPTEEEVKVACLQSGALHDEQQKVQMQTFPQHTAISITEPNHYLVTPVSHWSRFREFLHMLLIISGATYGLYFLYKKYVVPFLFGKQGQKNKKSVAESLEALDEALVCSVRELRENIRQVQNTLAAQQRDLNRLADRESEQSVTTRHIQDLKTEIASVKGLLLSRRQFPATPNPSPSIPAWQLPQEPSEHALQNGEGSGSPSPTSDTKIQDVEDLSAGSSETVLVSKAEVAGNSSDSSLEMLRD